MKLEKISEDDLLNYIDGTADNETRARVERFSSDPDISKRMKELRAIHNFLQNGNTLAQPSKNFTDKVMGKLHEKSAGFSFSPRNGLILLAGILVASGLAMALLSVGSFDQLHTLLNLQSLPVKNDFVTLPTSIPFDLKVVMKIFLMINLVLALVLIDRTILRPIFQRRAERFA